MSQETSPNFQTGKSGDDFDSDGFFVIANESLERLGHESQENQEPLSVIMVRSQMAMSQSGEIGSGCAAVPLTGSEVSIENKNKNSSEQTKEEAKNSPTVPGKKGEPETENNGENDHLSTFSAFSSNYSGQSHDVTTNLSRMVVENVLLKTEVKSLSSKLKDAVGQFDGALSQCKQRIAEQKKKEEQYIISMNNLKEENARLVTVIDRITGEKEELKAASATSLEQKQEIDALEASMENMRVEISRLKAGEEEAKLNLEIRKQTEAELVQVKEVNANLKSKIESMVVEVASVKSNNVHSEFLEDEKQKEIEDLKSKIKSMTAQMTLAQDQWNEVQPSLEALKEAELKLSQVTSENKDLVCSIERMTVENTEMKEQLEMVHMSLDADTNSQAEIKTLKFQIENLTVENLEIKHALKSSQGELNQQKQNEINALKLTHKNEELEAQIKYMGEEISALNGRQERKAAKVNLNLDKQTETEMNGLKSKIKSLTGQLRTADKKIRDQKGAEDELLQFLESQLRVKDELLEGEKRVFQDLNKLFQAEQDRTNDLKKKLCVAENNKDFNSNDFQRLASTEKALTGENVELKALTESMKKEMIVLKKEVEAKTEKVNSLKHDQEKFVEVVDEVKNQLTVLYKKLSSVQKELKKSNKEYKGLEELYIWEQSQTQELKEKIRTMPSTRDSTVPALKEHEKQIEKLDSELKKRAGEVETLRSQVRISQLELDQKQTALEAKDKEQRSYTEDVTAKISKMDQLGRKQAEEINLLREKLEAAESLNATVLEALSTLEKEKGDLNKRKEELKEAVLARKKCQDLVQKYSEKNKQLCMELRRVKREQNSEYLL